jgi:acetolactate synthase small subunit
VDLIGRTRHELERRRRRILILQDKVVAAKADVQTVLDQIRTVRTSLVGHVDSSRTDAEKVAQNLQKLVNVIRVEDISDLPAVTRDVALIKVETPDSRTRAELMQIVETFRARVVDVGVETLIVEATGTEEKVDGLVDVLRPFGIVEMVRTGRVAMVRGKSVNKGEKG